MIAFVQSPTFAFMVRYLQIKSTTWLFVLSMLRIYTLQIATLLDQHHGVAIRSGHRCAQPLHRYLGVGASARASLYFYNTREDVDAFIHALNDTVTFFNSFT
ncbi:hypothetical protein M0R45_026409 [Rubus argutus]|uniref:Aminotransferase class V domain-containing protein n=1 Tax=Rubus argutus TaxID=59490 RepID=A0AAW1WZZ0_RUBAR